MSLRGAQARGVPSDHDDANADRWRRGPARTRMKIAMLGPIAWRTPPTAYGPWERVTSLLTEGLVQRGIDVTLFATGDSLTNARLDAVSPHGYAEDPSMDGRVWEALHVAHALKRSAEFDLVHNQLDWLPLAFSPQCEAPMITTIHGFSGPAILPAYAASASRFVSISDSDRSPELEYVATIHHGIDTAELPLVTEPGDYLVTFGRIHPDKGTAIAIEIARRAGKRLVICGPIHDLDYFRDDVEPWVDGDRVVFLGAVGADARARVLGHAAALIHPIDFEEPFGLSVVESMVCGTPVIAYRRGSMSEVIDEGVTGSVVTLIDEAVAALPAVLALDRRRVSARAAVRFGIDRMVDQYVHVYESVLSA